MSEKKPRLTAKRERFCQEMIKPKADLSKAYRVAFKAKGMKAQTIHSEAYRLMKNPQISARISELTALAAQAVVVTRAEWLQKLKMVCFDSDIRKMFKGPGELCEIAELGEAEAMRIDGFEFVENFETVSGKPVHVGYTKKVKLSPKVPALMDLGKAMGFMDVEELPKGPQRLVIREWVRHEEEEHHVYHHDSQSATDGVRVDQGGHTERSREHGGRAAVEAGAPDGGGTDRPPESAGRAVGRAGRGYLQQSVQAEVPFPAADAETPPAVQHHEPGRGDVQHELLVSQHRTRTVRVREIVAEEEDD